MEEAEFVFHQTEKERKAIAQGARHKKRGGGRYVRTPSDYATRKEKEAMNGECRNYNIAQRMTWKEFKKMPKDLQEEYIGFLQSNFNAGYDTLGEIFGVSGVSVYKHLQKEGIRCVKQTKATAAIGKKKLERWLQESEPKEESETIPENEPVELFTDKAPKATDIPRILELLAGTGARITIELTL